MHRCQCDVALHTRAAAPEPGTSTMPLLHLIPTQELKPSTRSGSVRVQRCLGAGPLAKMRSVGVPSLLLGSWLGVDYAHLAAAVAP